MNSRRGFWLWLAITIIWYSGFSIAGYMTKPDKDWIYWASSTQSLAKTAPSQWSENKPFGFGDNIAQTRQGLKIAIPSNYAQRYRQASYIQRVESAIWKRHRLDQLKNNLMIVIAPVAIFVLGFAVMWGLRQWEQK